MSTGRNIANNTLMLYVRQLLVLIVSLYTVRIVLETLGIEDYGIYNVVGGVVSFFSFLSASMASATQRFFAFEIGKDNGSRELKKVFSINVLIYSAISLIAFLLLESVGLWFVSNKLNVPSERYEAALWVFHTSCVAFVISVLRAPLNAIIIAHEDMKVYAYISVLEVFMKLVVVYVLFVSPYDKLQIYGVLSLLTTTIIGVIYFIYCLKSYPECRIDRFYYDKPLIKKIVGFTGWTLFGQASTVARQQALTILVNQYFSPVTIAARAISTNICNQVNVFSNNFNISLYPPIIKSYSRGDVTEMHKLVFKGSKVTFLLFWIFAFPIFMEMDTILELWLVNPPPEAVLFTRLGLIEVLVMSISLPIATAARAPGKMKLYELTLGFMQFMIFFLSWLVLSYGYPAYSIYIVAGTVSGMMFLARLYLVQNLIGLSVKTFLHQVALRIIVVIFLSSCMGYLVTIGLPSGIWWSFVSLCLCFSCAFATMWIVGWNQEEREQFKSFVLSKIRKQKT